MSRFLTSMQLLASLAVTLLLIFAQQSGADTSGASMVEIAGYIALVGGVFLLTVQLLTRRLSSTNISGKLSFLFRIVLACIGAILLEPTINSFFSSMLESPLKILTIVTAAIFFLSLFFISPDTQGRQREFRRMMRTRGRRR